MIYKLNEFFQNHIINEQHGSPSKKSAITNLLIFYEYPLKVFSNNTYIRAIYTDFAKAFVKVNHELLVIILKQYGISCCL